MKTEEFKEWLEERYPNSETTVSNRISNCKKIEKSYNDLDKLYYNDKCKSLIDAFTYSIEDERGNVPAKHKIPINGNIREGSATLKQSIKLYVDFCNEYLDELYADDEYYDEDEGTEIYMNGFDSLIEQIGNQDKFIEFFVKNTYFFRVDDVKSQVEFIKNEIKDGNKIPVRYSQKMKDKFVSKERRLGAVKNRKQAVDISRTSEIFSKKRKEIKVECDSTGNKFVVDRIYNYTGYRVSTTNSNVINYSISHVWGETYDPYFFTSLWNIVLIPTYLNWILDKPKDQQEINEQIQSIIKALCIKLYNPNVLMEDIDVNIDDAYLEKAQVLIDNDNVKFLYPRYEVVDKELYDDTLSNKDFIVTALEQIKGKLNEELVTMLMNRTFCKEKFELAFPILREFNSSDTNFNDNVGNCRYYKQNTFFIFNNNKFMICNHWFPIQRILFFNWKSLLK